MLNIVADTGKPPSVPCTAGAFTDHVSVTPVVGLVVDSIELREIGPEFWHALGNDCGLAAVKRRAW